MYVVYANVYWKILQYFRTLCCTVCNYLWYKKLVSWCVMLTQLMSHFVDCFFERCFYSCTVRFHADVWPTSGANFIKFWDGRAGAIRWTDTEWPWGKTVEAEENVMMPRPKVYLFYITFNTWNYYLHYIRLTAFFQDNLGKPAPGR